MNDDNLIRAARLIEQSADMLTVTVSTALPKMTDMAGRGYPSSAQGANSGGGGSGDIPLTSVEAACGRPDVAGEHRAELARLIEHHWRGIVRIRQLVDLYGARALSAADVVAAGLAAVNEMWCTNCARHNVFSPRHGRAQLCTWCESFKGEYEVLPPKQLVDQHARGERVTIADVERALPKVRARKTANRR